jgi:heat shock protein HtpX
MSVDLPEPLLTWDRIDSNVRRTWLLLLVFGLLVFPVMLWVGQYVMVWVLWLAMAYFGDAVASPTGFVFGGIAALALTAVPVWLAYAYSAASILRITNAKRLLRGDAPELFRTVENLSIASGLPQPELYSIESLSPNAYAAGLDPRHASLVLTRGLLDLLERAELEAVVAQLFSQIGNYDTRLKTVASAIVSTLWLPVDLFKAAWRAAPLLGVVLTLFLSPILGLLAFGLAIAVSEGNPALILVMLMPFHVALLAPLAGSVLLRVISRTRVFLADADACLLTLNPDALALALTKLGASQTADTSASASLAHLFIVAPIQGGASHAHPSVDQRIAALRQLSSSLSPGMVAAARQTAADFQANRNVRIYRHAAGASARHPPAHSEFDNPSMEKSLQRSDHGSTFGGPSPAKSPGVAMLVLGGLGLASALGAILFNPAFGYLMIPQACYSSIVLLGGVRMLTLKAYGFARASAIVALFPFGPLSVWTLPIGIWSLITLNKPDVKAGFQRVAGQTGPRRDTSKPA